jgi:hypothetical protein
MINEHSFFDRCHGWGTCENETTFSDSIRNSALSSVMVVRVLAYSTVLFSVSASFFRPSIPDVGPMSQTTLYASPKVQGNFLRYREYQQVAIGPWHDPRSSISLAQSLTPGSCSDNRLRSILFSLHRNYLGVRSSSPSFLTAYAADVDLLTFRSPKGTSGFLRSVRLVVDSTIFCGGLSRFRSCEVICSYQIAHSLMPFCFDFYFPIVVSVFFLSDIPISCHKAIHTRGPLAATRPLGLKMRSAMVLLSWTFRQYDAYTQVMNDLSGTTI